MMPSFAVLLGSEHTGRGRCGFMGDTPGQLQCESAATIHLWLERADLGDDLCALACAEHVDAARLAGTVVDEHEFGRVCGLPGTRWDFDNHLCFIDDSGVELPAKAAAMAGAQ